MDLTPRLPLLTRLRLRCFYILSAIILMSARLWDSYWLVLSLTAVYIALAFFGLLAELSPLMRLSVILALEGACLFFMLRPKQKFRWPSRADIERAMEKAGNVAHRPLSDFDDKPVNQTDTAAISVWLRHRARLVQALAKIKIARFETTVAAQDTYSLRHAAGLLLVISFITAGPMAGTRLEQALAFNLPQFKKAAPVALDIWITPPDYTRLAPVFLARTQNKTKGEDASGETDVAVPENSLLKIRLSGHRRAPQIIFNGERLAAVEAGKNNFTLEMPLTQSGELTMRQGLRHLGNWQITALPDEPPAVNLVLAAKGEGNDLLKLSFKARDDHGLKKLTATIIPPKDLVEKMEGVPLSFDLPLPSPEQTYLGSDVLLTHTEDLTGHLLAGNLVEMYLSVEDAVGQTARSAAITALLPERKMKNKTAASLIMERKRLLYFDGPLTKKLVSDMLLAIVNRPALYGGDHVVFLALASAVKRIGYDGDEESMASVRDMLWDVALRIEDGGLSESAREFRQALQELSQAAQDPQTTQQELQELAAKVQEKMQKYLQDLAQQMQAQQQKQGQQNAMPPEMADRLMQRIDMNELMEQLREMANGNSREQMQKMAEFLKNALDNTDPSKMQQMQESQRKAMEALQNLDEIIRTQQELIDQTGKTPQGDPDMKNLSEAQDLLREELDSALKDLAGAMPNMPPQLGEASKHMKDAGEKLGQGQGSGSLPDQQAALKALKEGQDQALDAMAQAMKQMILSMGGLPKPGGNYGEGFDPLGRQEDGKQIGGDIVIPEEAERRRVQEIIRELRERSNETERPRTERDYIDRLLDVFY